MLPIVASLVLLGCTGYGHDVGQQVTRDHIRAIRLGMTRADVEALLGKPFAENHDEPDHTFLTYSRKPSGVRFFPMLWVHLQNGKVSGVYSRRYDRLLVHDDVPVYWLEGDIRMEGNQDDPGFNELFPK